MGKGGGRDNRVALVGLMAASAFCVGLLARLLDRFGVVVSPVVEVGLTLVVPLLLYPRLRPARTEPPIGSAVSSPNAPPVVVAAATMEVEEETHAGV